MPAGFAWRPRTLRATRLVMITAAELGNWQSHIKRLGIVPRVAFLFRATMEASHASENRPGFPALSARDGRAACMPSMWSAHDDCRARGKGRSPRRLDVQVSTLHAVRKIRSGGLRAAGSRRRVFSWIGSFN